MKIKAALYKAGHKIMKHSPLIYTTVGIVGLGATAYLAYKSRSKVEAVVEDLEEKRENNEPINKREVAKDIAEAIWVPVTVGVVSCVCIIMSHRIQHKRIVTLAGALAMEQARGVYFEKKYRAEHGDEAYEEFIVPKEKVVNAEDGEVTVQKVKQDIDKTIGQWYDESEHYCSDDHVYNVAMIDNVNDKMQTILFQKGHLLLNHVRDALGFERIRAGNLLGWSTSDSFEIEKVVTTLGDTENGELKEQIWVTWSRPRYIYDEVDFEGRYGIYQ